MIVTISSRVAGLLLDRAAAEPTREVCGLLLGAPDRVDDAVPARNVAPDPARSFEIDPAMLLKTHRDARGAGTRVIGHYHSHPDGIPRPSRRDAARAVENGQLWLIVAGGMLTGWQAVADDPDGSAVWGRFRPVTLAATA